MKSKKMYKLMLGVAVPLSAAAVVLSINHSISKNKPIKTHYSQSAVGGTNVYRAASVTKTILGGSLVYSMVPDGNGGVFVGGDAGKFDHLDSSGTPITGAAKTLLGWSHIYSMAPDGNGGVFVGGDGGQFDHLDSSDTPITGAAKTLLGWSHIYSMAPDGNGGVFVGGGGGKFDHLDSLGTPIPVAAKTLLGSSDINSMAPDGNGGVFVGGDAGKFDHLDSSGTPILGAAKTFPGGWRIYSMVPDGNGGVLVGGGAGQFDHLDSSDTPIPGAAKTLLGWSNIYSMVSDGHGGVFVGGDGGQFDHLDSSDTPIPGAAKTFFGGGLSYIYSMAPDGNGGVFVGGDAGKFEHHVPNGVYAPIITKTGSTDPKTTTSPDGTITLQIAGFDATTMDMNVDVGKINISTGVISELTSGQNVKVQVTPKTGNVWIDGTTTAKEYPFTANTQTLVGLTSPAITQKGATDPTTTTSKNGTITLQIAGFDATTMDMNVDVGTINPSTGVISGLTSGQNVKVQVTLKTGNVWTDGSKTTKEYPFTANTQTLVGLTSPAITQKGATDPTTTTSKNGTITLQIAGFDATTMDMNVDVGTINPSTGVISGLTSGQNVKVQVTLKTGNVWTDGSKTTKEYPFTANTQTLVGLTSPAITQKGATDPTTTTSKNGTITLQIAGFDATTMDMNVDVGTINPSTGVISGLTSGQNVKVQVTLKTGNVWTDGSKTTKEYPFTANTQTLVGLTSPAITQKGATDPTTTTSKNGTITLQIAGFDATTMDMNVDVGTINPSTGVISGLTSGQNVKVQVTLKTGNVWTDGSKTTKEYPFTANTQTLVGLTSPAITQKGATDPTTTTSKNGTITLQIAGFDATTMDMNVDVGTINPSTGVISGLTSGQNVKVQVTLKTGNVWTDGSKTTKEYPFTANTQTLVGLTSPAITQKGATDPTTTTSKNGTITLQIAGFDATTMDMNVDVGTINPSTGVISGLTSGQNVKVQVTLKTGNVWTDGSKTTKEYPFTANTQTLVGLTSPAITQKGATDPTTTTSKNGTITLQIAGFDDTTMDMNVDVGTINPSTGVISGLTSGQNVKVQVTLKTGNVWTDGSKTTKEYPFTANTQTLVGLTSPAITQKGATDPTTTTSKNGTITLQIAGFDATTMDMNVDVGTINPSTGVISGLTSGQNVKVQVTLKTGNVWTDGSKTTKEYPFTANTQTLVGLTSPAITQKGATDPTTTTSKNGTITLQIAGFDDTTMDMNVDVGTINPSTGVISGLTSGQNVKVQVTLKTGNVWTDGSKTTKEYPFTANTQTLVGLTSPAITQKGATDPTTTTSKNGTITLQIAGFDDTTMDMNVDVGTINPSTGVISGLTSGQNVKVQVTLKTGNVWTDGSKTTKEYPFTANTQTLVGLTSPAITQKGATDPTTTTSKNGTITLQIAGFDDTTMDMNVDVGTINPSTGVISGLTSGQNVKVQVTLKTGNVWTDGSKTTKEYPFTANTQTLVGLTSPAITQKGATDPTTTTSKNGTITLQIAGFDATTMDMNVDVGTINPSTGVISGLTSGQNVKVQVTLKTGNVWTDGSKTTKEYPFTANTQTLVGLTSPAITQKGATDPTTTTSKNGTITLQIAGFDDTTMDMNVDVGTINPSTGVISGLTSGQNVKVQVTLKTGNVWTDGTQTAKEYPFTANTQGISNEKFWITKKKIAFGLILGGVVLQIFGLSLLFRIIRKRKGRI